MTMAKGLTSGYAPLGAVAMREPIARFFDDRVYQGGLTYNGHPICLAAAIATIRVMQEDRLVERAEATGKVFARRLRELGEAHRSVGDVRSIGLFGVIELVRDRQTREPMAPSNASSPEMDALRKYLLDHGVFVYTHWHTLLLLPPLIITEEQLAEGFEVIDQALEITDRAAQS
jgi:taurine--2-oxoglutarate transaminase